MGQEHSKSGLLPEVFEDATEKLLVGCGQKRPAPEEQECVWQQVQKRGVVKPVKGGTFVKSAYDMDAASVPLTGGGAWFVRPGSSPQKKRAKQVMEQEIRSGSNSARGEGAPRLFPDPSRSCAGARGPGGAHRRHWVCEEQENQELTLDSSQHKFHAPPFLQEWSVGVPPAPPPRSSVLDSYMSCTPRLAHLVYTQRDEADPSSSSAQRARSRSPMSNLTPGQSSNPFVPRGALPPASFAGSKGGASSPITESPMRLFGATGGTPSPLSISVLSAASTSNGTALFESPLSSGHPDSLDLFDEMCSPEVSRPRPSAPNQTWVGRNPGSRPYSPSSDGLSHGMHSLDLSGGPPSDARSSSLTWEVRRGDQPFPKESPRLVVCTRTVAEMGLPKWTEHRQMLFLSSAASVAGVPRSSVRVLRPREKTGRRLLTVDLIVTFQIMAVRQALPCLLPRLKIFALLEPFAMSPESSSTLVRRHHPTSTAEW